MDISSINAAIGIIGSLSGVIYLGIVLYDRRKIKPPINSKENDPTRSKVEVFPSVPPSNSNAHSNIDDNAILSSSVVLPATTDGATEFVKNELAYQDWLKQHPQGFVVNTYAKEENRSQCVILHKSGCGSIRNYKGRVTPGAYTEREYMKVCADDIPSLARWAARIGCIGEPFTGVCGLCKPPVPTISPQPPTATHPVLSGEKILPVEVRPQLISWTPGEFAALLERCRTLPPAKGNYIIDDYVENVLLTVLDFQMQTQTVENAAKHYKDRVQFQINDFNDLQTLLLKFPDNKEGNTQVAEYLWGYKLWTRVGLLRRLLKFLGERGITTQEKLKDWAFQSDFNRDMAGKVKGIGFGIYKWLVMRQGVETIKPDIWVHRFVKQAVGRDMNDQETVNIVEAAAKTLNLKAYELDWRIWESRSSIAS